MDKKTQAIVQITAELTSIQAAKNDVAEWAAELLKARRDPRQREVLRRAAGIMRDGTS